MKNLLIILVLSLVAFNGFAYYMSGHIPLRDWGERVAHEGVGKTLENFSLSKIRQALAQASDKQRPAAASEKLRIYKWTDAEGVVHYDNTPVPGAAAITLDPNANILPVETSPKIPPEQQPAQSLKQKVQENHEKIQQDLETRADL